ncbi:MAG: pilus assembly protein PilM [Candidatus Riflebacteria bacterium]|nr:pilus assembly protein PilM [Candidatus Riflebacteria bacterium]
MGFLTQFNAVDLGTHSLKLLSLDTNSIGRGVILKDSIIEPLPDGLLSGGFTNPKIEDLSLFEKTLSNAISQISKYKEGFLVGLPERWVKIHLLDFPISDEDLSSRDFLSWKLKKRLLPPGLSSECMIDFQILSIESSQQKKTAKIMAGLIQQNIIDILSSIFVKLRMEVIGFDSSTMGIYNLLEELFPEHCFNKELIICQVGHETTNIKIFNYGILSYERVIEVGGENFGKKISEMENLSFSEAQLRKISQKYFPLTDLEILGTVPRRGILEKIFGNWLRELQVTFRFYQDRNSKTQLPPIFLTGGSSLFYGLPEFLGDYFDTSCQLFNPFKEITVPTSGNNELLDKGPMFAPSLGMLVD